MIRLSIAAASLALLAATVPGSAQEYNGGVFGMRQVYGNQYNNSYNSYRRPTYNNSYDNSYERGRRYGNYSSYGRQGSYGYRCTYNCN
jgi:hypothetical protein